MARNEGLAKVIDLLAEIIGFLTIVLIAFLYINAQFDFLTDIEILRVLYRIREYAILGSVILLGLEFSLKRGGLIFWIFVALAAVAVIFSFFPDVAADIVGRIQ